jgi:hypothetical protein
VEEPDLRELDGEVAKENECGAFPLFLPSRKFLLAPKSARRLRVRGESAWDLPYVLDLVLVEIGDHANNEPRQAPAKVNDFVHDEAHDSRGKSVILHPEIPSLSTSIY